MTKITTADCQDFLATDLEIQAIVKGRAGWDDDPQAFLEQCDDDPDEVKFWTTWVKNGSNPLKWKRTRKFKVGSKTDIDSSIPYSTNEFVEKLRGVDPTGGTVREFWLEGTDHITVHLLEKNGKIYFLDDLSD